MFISRPKLVIIDLFHNFIRKSKLSKLDKSELILDYTHSFSSDYMSYNGLLDWIKSMDYKQRMFYIIKSCDTKNPTKREQFLLSLAYHNLGSLYNEYSAHYIKMYLQDGVYYNKEFKDCKTKQDSIEYQENIFNSILANIYSDDLDFNTALEYAFKTKDLANNYVIFGESYGLIAGILCKMNNYDYAISILKEGIKNTKNQYSKKHYEELIIKYTNYKNKGYIFKPKNIKRSRLKYNSNEIYDLTEKLL